MSGYERVGFGFELNFQDKVSREIREARRQIKQMKRDSSELAGSFEKEVDAMEKSIARSRQGIARSKRLMIAGAAATAPFLLAGRQAMKAEDQWGDVATLLAAQGDNIDLIDAKLTRFQTRVVDVGGRVAIPIEELRESWYRLQSALGEQQALAGLEKTGMLALAARGNMETAVDAATSLMKTYGDSWGTSITDAEKFDRIMNTLAGTVAAYNTDLGNLQEAMKYVSGSGSKMNIQLEETAATVGTLQTRGLQGARAGTSLNMMLQQLLQAPEKFRQMAKGGKKAKGTIKELMGTFDDGKASKELKELAKIELTNAQGQLRSMVDIIEDFEKALGITSQEAKDAGDLIAKTGAEGTQAFKAFGISVDAATYLQQGLSEEGARAMLMLLGQADAIRQQTDRLQDSNVLQAMFNAKNRTTASEVKMATNKVKGLAEEIGTQLLPAVKTGIELFGGLLEKMRDFNKEHPDVVKWGAMAGAGGAVGTFGAGALMMPLMQLRMMRDLKNLYALQRQMAGLPALAPSLVARLLPLLAKGGLYAAAAYAGHEAGKFAYYKTGLREILPGTSAAIERERWQKQTDEYMRSVDAQIKLSGWGKNTSKEIGLNIGESFKGTVLADIGGRAGAEFGEAAGEAFRDAKDTKRLTEEQIESLLNLPGSQSLVIRSAIEEARKQSGDLEVRAKRDRDEFWTNNDYGIYRYANETTRWFLRAEKAERDREEFYNHVKEIVKEERLARLSRDLISRDSFPKEQPTWDPSVIPTPELRQLPSGTPIVIQNLTITADSTATADRLVREIQKKAQEESELSNTGRF